MTCEHKSDQHSPDIPTIVIFSSLDVRLHRQVSSDTSRNMSFQNDRSGDWGGSIRAMSSRALCNAVTVNACPSLYGGWVDEEAKGDLSNEGVDGDLWATAAEAYKRECTEALLVAASLARSCPTPRRL